MAVTLPPRASEEHRFSSLDLETASIRSAAPSYGRRPVTNHVVSDVPSYRTNPPYAPPTYDNAVAAGASPHNQSRHRPTSRSGGVPSHHSTPAPASSNTAASSRPVRYGLPPLPDLRAHQLAIRNFSIPVWSTTATNPTARLYDRVAQRRVAAQALQNRMEERKPRRLGLPDRDSGNRSPIAGNPPYDRNNNNRRILAVDMGNRTNATPSMTQSTPSPPNLSPSSPTTTTSLANPSVSRNTDQSSLARTTPSPPATGSEQPMVAGAASNQPNGDFTYEESALETARDTRSIDTYLQEEQKHWDWFIHQMNLQQRRESAARCQIRPFHTRTRTRSSRMFDRLFRL